MNTKFTLLAALLLAGASQAALAQEHDHDRWSEPGQRQGPPATAHANGGHPAAPVARPAPPPAPPPGHWNGGEHRNFQPEPGVASPQPGPRPDRGGDHRWDNRNGFAPGGGADGDRRWDRRDAPREVVPPGPNAERGWDREHDGHAPGPGYASRPPRSDDRHWSGDDRRWDRDGGWNGDHRGPPPNWRHWERGRLPPIYAAPHRYRWGPYERPYGWFVRSWVYGDILPRGWYGPGYWIDDFWDLDLPYPPPGYHWVRVGDDALLVSDFSGRIVQVVRDIFW